jgi:hypothetical protein
LTFEKGQFSIVIEVKNGHEGDPENGQKRRFSLCPIENGHFWSILGVFKGGVQKGLKRGGRQKRGQNWPKCYYYMKNPYFWAIFRVF